MPSSWGAESTRPAGSDHVEPGSRGWIHSHLGTLLPWIVASIAALQTSYLVTWSVRDLTERGIAMDDSYFYAVLARNYDKLGYLTFDGSMPTNGVQPLWQWLIIVLHQAFPGVEPMRSSFAANWLLYALFCWLIIRYALSVCRDEVLVLVVTLLVACNPAFQTIVLRGMEMPLFLVCFTTFLIVLEHTIRRWQRQRARVWDVVLLALVAAATFLARTDWFWVVPLGALFIWKQAKQWRPAALFGATASLLVVPYLAHNWAVHGHMMPISGRTKLVLLELHTTSFSDYLRCDEWHGVFAMLVGIFGLDSLWFAIPLVGLAFVAVKRFSFASPSVRFLLVGVACHTLFMHLVYREVRPYTRYYFSAECIAAAYLLAETLTLGISRAREQLSARALSWIGYAGSSAAALLVIGATLAFYATDARNKWVWRWHMAERLRSLPAHQKVAAFWPGLFSYVSGRPVFPLDGIVGSEAYLDVVRQGKELAHARRQGIDYVVIADLPPDSLYASQPPQTSSWAELGKLRLWQDCPFVKRLIAKHGNPNTADGWYLYELLDVPTNEQCRTAPGRSGPSMDQRASLGDNAIP